VLNISPNSLENEQGKFYQQAICVPNANLWHIAFEAEIDTLQHNHTWDMVDRPTDRKIVNSKWVFIIKHLSDKSVDRFTGQ
jgi:hypothetical protein